MNKFLGTAMRFGSVAALASALIACGPDDTRASKLAHFSLSGSAGDEGYSQDAYAEDDLTLLPAALPMSAGDGHGQDYEYAPSWDYESNSYVEYDDAGPYNSHGSAESYGADYAPYDGDQTDYYDQSAGADQYAWLALATMIAGVIGDSPPDYGFAHSGVRPWAWRTSDGYTRYAEPVRGGQRYYYYKPNATRPFLVRDPYYSYGYRGDRLETIYDRDGRVLNQRALARQRLAARNYFERAERLHRAGRADSRHGIAARQWEARRIALAADRRDLREAREQRSAWRQWDRQNQRELASRWQLERESRERAARRFASWRETAYSGEAPRFYEVERQERARAMAEQQRDRRSRALALSETQRADARQARQRATEERQTDRRQLAVRQQARAEAQVRTQAQEERRARLAASARTEQRARLAQQRVQQTARASAAEQARQARAATERREKLQQAERQRVAGERREAQEKREALQAQQAREKAAANRQQRLGQQQAARQQAQRKQQAEAAQQRKRIAAETAREHRATEQAAQVRQQAQTQQREQAAQARRRAAEGQQREQAVQHQAARARQTQQAVEPRQRQQATEREAARIQRQADAEKAKARAARAGKRDRASAE